MSEGNERSRECRWCARIRGGGAEAAVREGRGPEEERMGIERLEREWERYLQIPTYLRWGRRLQVLDRSE